MVVSLDIGMERRIVFPWEAYKKYLWVWSRATFEQFAQTTYSVRRRKRDDNDIFIIKYERKYTYIYAYICGSINIKQCYSFYRANETRVS